MGGAIDAMTICTVQYSDFDTFCNSPVIALVFTMVTDLFLWVFNYV